MTRSTFLGLLVLTFLGCATPRTSPEEELFSRSSQDMLSPERAHIVRLRLTSFLPAEVCGGDLIDIATLVGRIPGLGRYEISRVDKSPVFPDGLQVWVSTYVISVRRDAIWQILNITQVSP